MLGRQPASTPAPRQRPLPRRAGPKGSLQERLKQFLRAGAEQPAAGEAGRRRRLLTFLLVAYFVVLFGGALAVNVPLLNRQTVAREQAERDALRIASTQRLMAELEQEQVRHGQLLRELDERYRALPGAADLPVAMEKLRELAAVTGGSAHGVDYSEPRWSGSSGQLQTRAAFSGFWQEALAFIAALDAALPASALERLSVRLDGQPGRVAVDLTLSMAVMRERPAGKPVWDPQAAWARAETAARGVVVSGFPFTPGALLWYEGRAAGMGLPELRLAGIARQRDGATVALVVYDGESRLVRPGSRVGVVEVVTVEDDGVVITISGRPYKLQVGKAPVAL